MAEEVLVRKCTWCNGDLKVAHCDYWDEKERKWKLELCEKCYKSRFDLRGKTAEIKQWVTDFLKKLETL